MIRWATKLIGKAGAPSAAKAALGLVAIIVLQSIAFGLLMWRYNAAQQQIGAQAQQLAQARQDNQVQTEHIRSLGREIQDLTGQIAIEQQALAEAERAAESGDRQREEASEAETEAREAIYEREPECEAWALQLVCQQIAGRMIDRRQQLIDRWADESDGDPDE